MHFLYSSEIYRNFRDKFATQFGHKFRAGRVRACFEARRESAAFLLVQTPALSPPLSLALFSLFPFRPSNLGLFGASLQTPAPEKNSKTEIMLMIPLVIGASRAAARQIHMGSQHLGDFRTTFEGSFSAVSTLISVLKYVDSHVQHFFYIYKFCVHYFCTASSAKCS